MVNLYEPGIPKLISMENTISDTQPPISELNPVLTHAVKHYRPRHDKKVISSQIKKARSINGFKCYYCRKEAMIGFLELNDGRIYHMSCAKILNLYRKDENGVIIKR